MAKSPLIRFSYFGDREYLDVTSILDALWEYFGSDHVNNISEFHLKIFSGIKTNCYLLYSEDSSAVKNNSACLEFSWLFNGTKYFGQLIPTDEIITTRIPEVEQEIENHLTYKYDTVILNKKFNDNITYNLMKMGKFLVSQKYDPNVRVVKFYFRESDFKKVMQNVSMHISSVKNDFIKMTCKNNEIEFGYIVVKQI